MEGSGLVGKMQAGALSTFQAPQRRLLQHGAQFHFHLPMGIKIHPGDPEPHEGSVCVCVCVLTEGFVPSTSSPQTDQHRL